MRRGIIFLEIFGLASILTSVILEGFIGVEATTILGSVGTVAFIAYAVLRRLAAGFPRFLAVKNYLAASLLAMSGGAAFLSAGATENLLFSSGSAGIPLKTAGLIIYILGVLGIILAIAMSRPMPASNL